MVFVAIGYLDDYQHVKHHHFEMCGWKETKVVAVFASVSAVFCVLAYLGVMNRFGI